MSHADAHVAISYLMVISFVQVDTSLKALLKDFLSLRNNVFEIINSSAEI